MLPSFELATRRELFYFVLIYRARRCHHHLDAIDYLHHSIALKYAFLSLSLSLTPSPFTYLTDQGTSSTTIMTLTVTLTLSPLACEPSILLTHSLLIFSQNKTPPFSSLTDFFGYVVPEVIKNTGHGKPMDIWLTSMIASTRIHKRNAGSLLSLSAQLLSRTFSSAVTPLFVPTIPCPLLSKMLIPKLNFRVRA